MKRLYSMLAICLFAVTAQAQSPFLSGAVAGEGYSTINVGAEWQLSNYHVNTYMGFVSNRAESEWFSIGVGADTKVTSFAGLNLIAGLDLRYLGADSDNGAVVSPKAGFAIPINSSRLSIYTSADRVFFSEASTKFSFKDPGLNWVPVSVSLAF